MLCDERQLIHERYPVNVNWTTEGWGYFNYTTVFLDDKRVNHSLAPQNRTMFKDSDPFYFLEGIKSNFTAENCTNDVPGKGIYRWDSVTGICEGYPIFEESTAAIGQQCVDKGVWNVEHALREYMFGFIFEHRQNQTHDNRIMSRENSSFSVKNDHNITARINRETDLFITFTKCGEEKFIKERYHVNVNWTTDNWLYFNYTTVIVNPEELVLYPSLTPQNGAKFKAYNKVIQLYLGRYTCFIATLTGRNHQANRGLLIQKEDTDPFYFLGVLGSNFTAENCTNDIPGKGIYRWDRVTGICEGYPIFEESTAAVGQQCVDKGLWNVDYSLQDYIIRFVDR
eukprot:sb/3466455/